MLHSILSIPELTPSKVINIALVWHALTLIMALFFIDTGDPMVRCARFECGWYHYACINLQLDEAPDGDWWCSDECQASFTYIYCNCHRRGGQEEDMVQCELQSRCQKDEWYHPQCIPGGANNLPGTLNDNSIQCEYTMQDLYYVKNNNN